MESSPLTRKLTMGGIFGLLEKIAMKFPVARGGLDDKIQFNENISFKLTSSNGKTVTGS